MKQLLVLLLFVTCSVNAQEWQLKKNSRGIKVYTRQLDSSKIHEYKAVAIVKTTPEKALKTITDGDNLWRWNHKTSQSKTVKKISPSEFVFWMKNELPWPVKNRDNVSHITVNYLPKGEVRIDIFPDKTNLVKEREDCIRVTNFKGYWLISPKEDGLVEITQQLYGDPNGQLPAWLLNSVLTTVPYHSFLNLKEILEK